MRDFLEDLFPRDLYFERYCFRDKMNENRCQICGLKVANRIALLQHYYAHLLLAKFKKQKSSVADFVHNLKTPDWTKFDLKRELFLERMSAAWVHLKGFEIDDSMRKELNTTLGEVSKILNRFDNF